MDPKILAELQVFSIPVYERVVYGIPAVCLYLCVYVRLDSPSTRERILFMFDVYEFIHHVRVEAKILLRPTVCRPVCLCVKP
jgi:hypothetical protein